MEKKYLSYRTLLESKIRFFAKNKDLKYSSEELYNLLRGLLIHYNQFHPILKVSVNIKGWKGKTTPNYKNKFDYIEVIGYRKKDKFATPQPFKLKIYYKDFENMLKALKNLSNYQIKKIPSEVVAAEYFRVSNISENKYGEPLFNKKGFIPSHYYHHRIVHVTLTEIWNVLDKFGVIEYLKGYINILDLNKRLDFQTKFTTL